MVRKSWIVILIVVAALGITALVVFFSTSTRSSTTTLTFDVRDILSEEWVYDSTITVQDRVIRGYFDTDFRFTNLDTGSGVLKVSAPSYVSREVPVEIRRGENTLEQPVDMTGYEIPNLDHFIMIEDVEEGELVTEVRPVGTDGRAVVNHPCVDLRLLLLVSEQVYDGELAQSPTEEGSVRGERLFRGALEWRWDSDPGTIFRYTVPIPVNKFKQSRAPLWVFDYLLIVPDPREIAKDTVDEIVQQVEGIEDPEAVQEQLDAYEGRIRYFINTSWNVEAQQ